MTTSPAPSLQLLRNYIVTGYLPGWQQPLAIVEVAIPRDHDIVASLQSLHNSIAATLPGLILPAPPAAATPAQLGSYLIECLQLLLTNAQYLQLAPPRCETMTQPDGTTLVILLLPTFGVTHTALNLLAEALLQTLAGSSTALTTAMQLLARQRPAPGVTTRLLQAAVAGGIPWLHINDNIYQFGWGRAACLMDSSFTERTSNIGVRLARNKHQCAQVLRQAGLPVPAHELVKSVQQAQSAAARLGYPVVVKPSNLDQGVGVAAGLQHPAAVVAAWQQARKHSTRILVEKHIEGRDYRVIVLHGKVISIVERVPAGVTGDGVRDITALLQEVNSDPRRQSTAQRLVQIVLDETALSLLAEQQLCIDSVPAKGREVRLRRSANIATGGSPRYLSLEQAHPDNLLLCLRAASALRLDLAGIDFLIGDIGQSWRDIGGAICEVNSQPQMQPDLPARILHQLVAGQGRIPVIAIIAAPDTKPWWREVATALMQRGAVIGMADTESVQLNDATIADSMMSAPAAALLLREPTLAAALLIISNAAQLRDGAPTDKLDLLVLATDSPPPKSLQLLQGRIANLWCVDGSEQALPAKTGKVPTLLTASQLAPALTRFLDERL